VTSTRATCCGSVDRLSALVDWQWARVGHRSIDPAHCWLNVFQYSQRMADDVLTIWEQRSAALKNAVSALT